MADRMPDAPLDITLSGTGEHRIVMLKGELDAYTSPVLRERMLELIDDGARELVLDLSGIELIDSTGLGVLVGVLKRLLQHDGALELRSLRPAARRVLDITGLDRVFTIVD